MEEKKSRNETIKYDHSELLSFFEENKIFEDNDGYKGVFALGVLVRYTIDIQRYHLKNSPFEKKLKNLKLNFKDLQNIFRDACNKLNQYKENQKSLYYMQLRELVTAILLANEYSLKAKTANELSYYFTCGLELGNKFKTKTISS